MTHRRAVHRTLWSTLLPAAGACTLLLAAGCSTGSTAGTAAASPAGGLVAQGTSTDETGTTASVAPAPPTPVAGTCPAPTKLAHIDGAATCLAPGLACTKADRDQYPTYGFLCLPKSTQYVLFKK